MNQNPEDCIPFKADTSYPYLNERMKIIHKDNMENITKTFISWYRMTMKRSVVDDKNEFKKGFQSVVVMLENELQKAGILGSEDVFRKYLFPLKDYVLYIAGRPDSSECPCVVYDQNNKPVHQVVKLGKGFRL